METIAETPVLSVSCKEPGGAVIRHVHPTRLTLDKLKFLWEKLSKFDVLFNDFTKGDFTAFINHFIIQVDGELQPTGLMWDVDDVGMFLLNDLKPLESASAHFVFWDERFRGREKLCREMLKFVFDTYKFRRINLQIPVYATATLQAVDRIGFVREGRLRQAIKYKDGWFDIIIFSMLNEDLADGERLDRVEHPNTKTLCHRCSSIYHKRHVRGEHDGTANSVS